MNILDTTKTINTFLESFGVSAWLEDCVPVGIEGPFCTYSLTSEAFDSEGLIQVHFYEEGTSIRNLLDLTNKLREKLGHGGLYFATESGGIWIYKGAPFAQVEPIPNEENYKAMYINLVYREF